MGMRLSALPIALSIFFVSCGVPPCPAPSRERTSQAHRFASLYEYSHEYKLTDPFSLLLFLHRSEDFEEILVHFKSPFPTGYMPNDVARGFYYRPTGRGPYPAVIVLPRFGVDEPSMERRLAREWVRERFAVFVLVLPWHMGRKGEGPSGLRLLWEANMEKLTESVRQAVLDIRRTIDWLAREEHIDPARIGILGISLGAFIANLALAVDERLAAGVSIFGGGDMAHAVWHSPLALWQRWQLRKKGLSEEELAESLRPYNPVTLAGPGLADRLYMINGRFDLLVPSCSVEEFWQKAGRPPITWLNSGHLTAYFWRHKILELSKNYLTKKLAPPPR